MLTDIKPGFTSTKGIIACWLEKFPLDSNDRFLSILPLSHTFEATGGLLCPLAMGVAIHYMQGLPTPQKLLSSMETARPTGVLTVPENLRTVPLSPTMSA